MTVRSRFKITNYLHDDFKDAFVTRGSSTVDPFKAVTFLQARAIIASRGDGVLSNAAIADLLIRFYGFDGGNAEEPALELDVEMETKNFYVMGKAQPDFYLLHEDPDYHAPGIDLAIVAKLRETTAR